VAIKRTNDIIQKILLYIIEHEKTNYRELSYHFDLSVQTIANHVAELKKFVMEYHAEIQVKPNTGIRFWGDAKKVLPHISKLHEEGVNSKEEREEYSYHRLLFSSDYLKIQDLADEMYVSRTTAENTIQKVKQQFQNEGIFLESNRNGLRIVISEEKRRKIISRLAKNREDIVSLVQHRGKNLNFNEKISSELFELFNQEVVEKIIDIVQYFIISQKLAITDYEYQSLIIHLIIAIDRIQSARTIEASEIFKDMIMREQTTILVDILEKEFAIILPDAEREYINIHFVAIERNKTQNSRINPDFLTKKQVKITDDLKEIINDYVEGFHGDYDLIESLYIHLNSAIKRLQLGLNIYNPYTHDIKKMFPNSLEIAVGLAKQLEAKYKVILNDDEITYIMIHIQSFFERKKSIAKKNVVVVCSSGFGTSKFLEQKLYLSFQTEINITRVLSLRELEQTTVYEDFIISTIPLFNQPVPVIHVKPFLSDFDKKEILRKGIMKNAGDNERKFLSLISDSTILIEDRKITRIQVIKKLGNALIENKFANENVIEYALERERLSSTSLGNVAIPHVVPECVLQSTIAIYINKQGIKWGDEIVHIVFFFTLKEDVKKDLADIYEYFMNLIANDMKIRKLIKATNKEQVRKELIINE
jgi:Transcriptional antiterminator